MMKKKQKKTVRLVQLSKWDAYYVQIKKEV